MIDVIVNLLFDVGVAVVRGCHAASTAEKARLRERQTAAMWAAFANERGMQNVGGGHRLRGDVGGSTITIDTGIWAEAPDALTIFSPSRSTFRGALNHRSLANFPNYAGLTGEMRAALEALRAPFELTCDARLITLVIRGPLAQLDSLDAACATVAALARGQSANPYR